MMCASRNGLVCWRACCRCSLYSSKIDAKKLVRKLKTPPSPSTTRAMTIENRDTAKTQQTSTNTTVSQANSILSDT